MIIFVNNKLCVLLGDWNLDVMKYDRYSLIVEFLVIMYLKMFFFLIIYFIRIIFYIVILFDNKFINSLDSFCVSGVLFLDVLDYLLVFIFFFEKMNVEDKKIRIIY